MSRPIFTALCEFMVSFWQHLCFEFLCINANNTHNLQAEFTYNRLQGHEFWIYVLFETYATIIEVINFFCLLIDFGIQKSIVLTR